jgi:hypothetical protein
VVDSARRNGYDETVVRAFVSAPDEVWMLERAGGGERIFVGRPEYREAFGADPPVTRGGNAPARAAVEGLQIQLDAIGVVVMDGAEGVTWRVRLSEPVKA